MTLANDTQRINAIVGEAIKALVESGASVDIVGSFAQNYPAKVANILAKTEAPSEPVDIVKVIQETVVRAVRAAGLVHEKAKSDKSATRVNVVVQGKRTTVFLPNALMCAVIEVKGSQVKAKALVQEFADTMPEGIGNRSAWIDEKLHGFLVLSATPSIEAPRH